uniref:Putative reverse transcriptase-like protein n=1 Tax=viral metagenome TaxID=1070528 RepID=A0A6M3JJT5_9ZZZZ
MIIYVDSSLREACYVPSGQEPTITPYPEPVTVNVGEYKAVILALEWAENRQLEEVEFLTDSQLVVNQVSGKWQCKKAHLLPYRDKVRDILLRVSFIPNYTWSLDWIERGRNLAGKVLE